MQEKFLNHHLFLKRLLQILGGCVAALLAVMIIAAIALAIDADIFRKPTEKLLSAALHRDIKIGGLQINLFRLEPEIIVKDLHICNPQPFTAEMGSVQKIDLKFQWLPIFTGHLVLPMLNIQQPVLALVRTADKQANWTFGQSGAGSNNSTGALPVIQHLTLNGGSLSLDDALQKLKFTSTIATTDAGSDSAVPFAIVGQGTLNNKPFKMNFSGPSLLNLAPDMPYNFDVMINFDQTAIHAKGTLPKPFDMTNFDTQLDLKGNDLADLYYLTGLAFPNTPPYHLNGELTGAAHEFHFSNFGGNLGSSDLLGDIKIETGQKKPKIIANLTSKLLDFKDLGALFGTHVAGSGTAATANKTSTVPVHLLPDAPLQVERVRAMDAEVHYRAEAVNAPGLPLKQVLLDFYLENSILQFKPFAFTLPQGKLAGTAQIDAQSDVPVVDMDVRLTNAHLEDFSKKTSATMPPPIEGPVAARVKLHGFGDSVHKAAATANGEITMVVSRGKIRRAFAELLGIDVMEGAGLLLSGDQQQTDLRCGIADFQVARGILTPRIMVFDTGVVVTQVSGNVNLNSEALDLELKGAPKEARLIHLMAPITIGGTLAKPSIGVDPKTVAAQTGVAAALSTVLTPLVGILPFVDLDLAKDADCAGLLNQAGKHSDP